MITSSLLLPLLLLPGLAPPPVQEPVESEGSLGDLTEFQVRVDGILERCLPATVGLRVGGSNGTGVLVSEDGLVLTAGHVISRPGVEVTVILADGRELTGRSLGVNPTRDSGMVRVEGASGLPFVPIPAAGSQRLGSWCVALGHPGGFQEGRPPVPRLGRLHGVSGPFVATDCPVIFGDSGGPLFDLHGNLIGIHSRIEEEVSDNYHVPMSAYRIGRERLLAGESWTRGGVKLGVRGVSDGTGGGARLGTVVADRPGSDAGLESGDVLLELAGEPVSDAAQLRRYLDDLPADCEVTLLVQRGEERLALQVRFGEGAR